MIALQTSERNGALVGAIQLTEQHEILLISNQGTLVRTRAAEVSQVGPQHPGRHADARGRRREADRGRAPGRDRKARSCAARRPRAGNRGLIRSSRERGVLNGFLTALAPKLGPEFPGIRHATPNSVLFRPALLALALSLSAARRIAAAPTPPPPAEANRIAAARDRVLPVVVSILTVRQDYRQGEPSLSVSSGSGTIVSPQGHIATNAHVTQNGKSFRVVFADGRELPAKLVGTDTLSDLAVLQVQPPKPETFAYAEFVTSLMTCPRPVFSR